MDTPNTHQNPLHPRHMESTKLHDPISNHYFNGDQILSFSLPTPCAISDLLDHLISLPFIGKGHLVPTDVTNPSSNVLTHISPLLHITPFHFIQTHDFFYCASCHLPILNQRIYHPQEQSMYHPASLSGGYTFGGVFVVAL